MAGAAALCQLAAPAAAQELSNAEIEDYIRDRCLEDAELHIVDLGTRLTESHLRKTESIRSELQAYWENPGYLFWERDWIRSDGRRQDGDNTLVPLSSVTVSVRNDRLVRFECIDGLQCIYREAARNERSSRVHLRCRLPDRVVRAFETWIDRNVTRMTWEDPFAE